MLASSPGCGRPAAELDAPLREAVAGWLSSAWPFERPLYEPLLG